MYKIIGSISDVAFFKFARRINGLYYIHVFYIRVRVYTNKNIIYQLMYFDNIMILDKTQSVDYI